MSADTDDHPAVTVELPREADNLPWADRRLADRLPARNGARVEIRRWGILKGRDIAEQLVDVSDIGIRVRLRATVRTGDQLDVMLWVPGGAWCVRSMGIVTWCVPEPDGRVLTGIRLRRRLTPDDFAHLAGTGALPAPPAIPAKKAPG